MSQEFGGGGGIGIGISRGDSGEDGRMSYKRRSSIVQQAKKDGILAQNVDLRGLSSGSGGQGPGGAPDSGKKGGGVGSCMIPTPLSRQGSAQRMGRGGGTTGGGIGRGRGSGQRSVGSRPSSSTLRKSKEGISSGRGKGQGTMRGGRNTVGPTGPKSNPRPGPGLKSNPRPGGARPSQGLGNSEAKPMPLRRSASFDSQGWTNTFMTTPTPAKGARTPMSCRSWGSSSTLASGRDNLANKGFRIPGVKDKEQLGEMMKYVHSVLEDYGFPNVPPNPLELKNLSTNMYLNVVRFVGQMLVGPKFFAMTGVGKDKEDPINKVVELATYLKYPAQISKSHLKSSNAQHAWPCCFTFLAWICSRVQAAYSPDPVKPMSDLFSDQFPHQLATESFLKLYHAEYNHFPAEDINTILEEELEKFRAKVCDQFMGEISDSKDILIAKKNERLKELEELRAIPDPTREVREALEKDRKKLEETEMKIANIEEKIALYQNVQTLVAQSESLRMEVQTLHSTVEALITEVKTQPIDREMADKMMGEIEEMKKQRECYGTIHQNLLQELEAKKAMLVELDNKFRQLVGQFTVVETFNQNLVNLRVENVALPVNPFTPEELEPWLTNAQAIHDKTERAVHKFNDLIHRDHQKYTESTQEAEKKLAELKRMMETKKVYQKAEAKLHTGQEKEKAETFQKLAEQIKQADIEIETKEKKLEAILKLYAEKRNNIEKIKEELKKVQDEKKEQELDSEDTYATYKKLEALMMEQYMDFTQEFIAVIKDHKKRMKELLEPLKEIRSECPEAFEFLKPTNKYEKVMPTFQSKGDNPQVEDIDYVQDSDADNEDSQQTEDDKHVHELSARMSTASIE